MPPSVGDNKAATTKKEKEMSKKMSAAYKALKVSDAVDAFVNKFQIAVIAIGLLSVAAMYFGIINPIVVIVAFAVLAVVAVFIAFIGVGAQIAIKALGYTEIDLERIGLA